MFFPWNKGVTLQIISEGLIEEILSIELSGLVRFGDLVFLWDTRTLKKIWDYLRSTIELPPVNFEL